MGLRQRGFRSARDVAAEKNHGGPKEVRKQVCLAPFFVGKAPFWSWVWGKKDAWAFKGAQKPTMGEPNRGKKKRCVKNRPCQAKGGKCERGKKEGALGTALPGARPKSID